MIPDSDGNTEIFVQKGMILVACDNSIMNLEFIAIRTSFPSISAFTGSCTFPISEAEEISTVTETPKFSYRKV